MRPEIALAVTYVLGVLAGAAWGKGYAHSSIAFAALATLWMLAIVLRPTFRLIVGAWGRRNGSGVP